MGDARSVIMLRKAKTFWIWRPVRGVQNNSRKCWEYAITCTLDMVYAKREYFTRDTVMTCAKDSVQNVKAFMAQLKNPNMMQCSSCEESASGCCVQFHSYLGGD